MLNNEYYLSTNTFEGHIRTESTRNGLGDALLELGKTNKEVVVLSADLMESTRVHKFAEQFPKRFFQVGVAEQNMAGVAAGLALCGKVPFITSFACFNPGRNWEQIRISICYNQANVKIVGTHAGLSASQDGATHQGLEDIALTRVLPNMTVICPADYTQTQAAVLEAADLKGPVYLRLFRHESPIFTTKSTPFEIGRAQVFKKGEDITIISCGPLVYEALRAARELSLKYRIEAEVINVHTIKPLDEDTLIRSALKTKKVLTLEEHQVAGGLGGAVTELLSEKAPVSIQRMGVKDSFGESGNYEELLDKYKLSQKHVVEMVKSLLMTARGKK